MVTNMTDMKGLLSEWYTEGLILDKLIDDVRSLFQNEIDKYKKIMEDEAEKGTIESDYGELFEPNDEYYNAESIIYYLKNHLGKDLSLKFEREP